MKKENNPLPDLLKYFRKKKHLTQEQVAKQLSVSRASYASYETGRIIPGMQHIMELSRILEHDFLFAYTLAVQNAPAGAMPEAVYEEKKSSSVIYGSSHGSNRNDRMWFFRYRNNRGS